MTKQESIQQILLEQISIPTKLFMTYSALGLTEVEVMVLLHIHRFLQAGIEFPTPKEIAEYLTIQEQECMTLLRKLMQKDVLAIKELKNNENQLSEAYSLEPLWEKLFKQEDNVQQPNEEGTIFIVFEQEFGRPLSPFEIETISVWLDEDEMKPALIKAALRESVLMGKLNFKYIDRILREWKKKGIRSVEQARTQGEKFRTNQVTKHYEVEKRDTSIYFNWLEGDD